MVAPVVAGAAIGAGAQLLGGLISDRSARRQQRESLAAQREFAQHGIRWRVEDAKAAGLHPLFALGASTSGPTIPVMESGLGRGLAAAGQDIGRAVASQETTEQRESRALQMRLAGAQVRTAEANAGIAEHNLARLQNQVGPPMPDPAAYVDPMDPVAVSSGSSAGGFSGPGATFRGIGPNMVSVDPSKVTSWSRGDRGIEAGLGTGMKWFQFPGGKRVLLPAAQSVSEALEAISENYGLLYVVVRENMRVNPNFMSEWSHIIPGLEEYRAFRQGAGHYGSQLGLGIADLKHWLGSGNPLWGTAGSRRTPGEDYSGSSQATRNYWNWRKGRRPREGSGW